MKFKNSFSGVVMLASAGFSMIPNLGICSGKDKSAKPLNFIFIMSDDHTSNAIGVYGSRLASLNPTPTIDKLASEATVFDNCFCTNAISTPSRSTILTGQYSHTNTVLTLDEMLTTDQLYLPKEMRKLGYQTAIVGKWHVGCEPTEFDYYNVLAGGGSGQGRYFDPIFASSDIKEGEFPNNIIEYKGHSTDVITDITLDWFKTKRDPDKPFFLLHHYKAPHDFFQYAPRYESYLADVDIPMPETLFDRDGFGSVATRGVDDCYVDSIATSISPRNKLRNYVDFYKITEGDDREKTIAAYNQYLKSYLRCVKGVDDNLERLFAYMKENDLWDNTVIVYTGDQGMYLGEHDLQDKRWMYEESLRMPLIVRIPGQKNSGKHEDLMVSNLDFAPTLLSLAGLKETPEYMQGKDFSRVFSGKEPKDWRTAHYYRYWMHMTHHYVPAHFGIRTKDYKLIFFYGRKVDETKYGSLTMECFRASKAAAKKKAPTYIDMPTQAGFELYDLKNDPQETKNVAEDPKYASVLKKLKKELLELKASTGDTDEKNSDILKLIDEYFAE